MALVATAGGGTSNSYVTQATANTYFADGNHAKANIWQALADSQKDQYLIMATRHIDMQPIRGGKYDTTTTSGIPDQRLKFPRGADYDGGIFIPLPVSDATYEQAVYLAEHEDSTELRANLQRAGVSSANLSGVAAETYRGAQGQLLCATAYQILLDAGLIMTSAGFSC